MLGIASLNDAFLASVFIAKNSTFTTTVKSFFTDRISNTICFNETHKPAPPFAYYPGLGGSIDNITLFLVQYEYIMFKYILSELENSLFLLGNETFDRNMVN